MKKSIQNLLNLLIGLLLCLNINAQNQPPVFSAALYTFQVTENALPGTYIGKVTATDANMDNLTFSTDASEKVSIDNNGKLYIYNRAYFDADETAGISMLISASDGIETATAQCSTTNKATPVHFM